MRRQVDVAECLPAMLDLGQRLLQASVRYRTATKLLFQGLLQSNEPFAFTNSAGSHVVEDGLDRSHLIGIEPNLILEFQEVRRPRHPVEFGRLRKPPAPAA